MPLKCGIKRDFPIIRNKLWKEMFWTRSFCLITTGSASIETIKQYIEKQGKK
ncbi:transposase [Anaerobacillus alkalidiazotrophicus]|uniref:transposase n=1 Tax=Anaerobacillus alkalidiazotrophicus TaxID=472963 RepID=UPI0038996E15